MRSATIGKAWLAACAALLALCGCHETQSPEGSSGSNWLACETLADCDDAPGAAACDAGYCVDGAGARIPTATPDGGVSHDAGSQGAGPPPEGPPEMMAPGDAGPSAMCAWGIDAQLAELDLMAPERVNCGQEPYWRTDGVQSGFACFDAALAQGKAVEFTVNQSIDSFNPVTFVGLADGTLFAMYWEEDAVFGDDLRESRVVTCDDVYLAIVLDTDIMQPLCDGEEEVYACTELVSLERDLPPPIPVTPRKVSDVIDAGQDATTLHLYVSNQRPSEPLVDIAVWIDDVYVVTGDFAVEDQHNWIQFDVTVPVGAIDVRAVTLRDDSAASQSFDGVPIDGETWGVLNYAGAFTFTPSDTPPALR